MTRGRLVRRKKGVYAAYKDHELVSQVREIFALGVNLTVSGETDMSSNYAEETEQEAKAAVGTGANQTNECSHSQNKSESFLITVNVKHAVKNHLQLSVEVPLTSMVLDVKRALTDKV